MIVEEAGQTLECHVVATLSSTIQHLICIGDPLQLRPSINAYREPFPSIASSFSYIAAIRLIVFNFPPPLQDLSVENTRGLGNKLYRFDVSLMERLADNGLEVSFVFEASYPKYDDRRIKPADLPYCPTIYKNDLFLIALVIDSRCLNFKSNVEWLLRYLTSFGRSYR